MMAVDEADVIVLGGGIVGVSIGVHLQQRGRRAIVVDRRGPGEETSFGNAGLIQSEGVFPHPFPRKLADLLRYARNRSTDASYHPAMLPRLLAPFLRYWYHSQPERYMRIARLYAPLIGSSLREHAALADAAGASHLIRTGGWVMAHGSPRELDSGIAEAELLQREFGIGHAALDPTALAALEPFLRPGLAGGLHWTDPHTVSDPHALTVAYAGLFERLGGRFVTADAATLARHGTVWRVAGAEGPIEAREVVVALGAWAGEVTRTLGYYRKLFIKRGYHMHYGATGNAVLNRPVFDVEGGYMLAPMRRGIRLTTGAEFAHRDAPATPVQLERAEPAARRLMPSLAERRDATPWLGRRPCTPDMMPIIGRAPGQRDAWFAFGHAHHGLTLGPTTGRLLAEMMTGEAPFIDPAPYRPERF